MRALASVLLALATYRCLADEKDIRVVSGVYMREKPKVLLYEHWVPLTLEIALPRMDEIIKPPECASQDYLCSLAKAAYDSIIRLQQDSLHNPFMHGKGGTNSRVAKDLLPFMGNFFGELYGMETHAEAIELAKQIKQVADNETGLAKAVIQDHTSIVAINKDLKSLAGNFRSYLTDFRSAFNASLETSYKTNLRNEGKLAYTAHQLIETIHFLRMMSLTETGSLECRNSLIPITMIGFEVVVAQFDSLRKRLSALGLELAGELVSLLSKKISSCVFTESFVYVHVRVPVRHVGSMPKLYKLTTVPFRYHDEQCIMRNVPQYVAVTKLGVYPITPNNQEGCKMDADSLCLIPSMAHGGEFASCAAVLISEHTPEDLIRGCSLECERTSKKTKVWISDAEVALTNYNLITMTCNGYERFSLKSNNSSGATVVRQGCGCTIMADDEEIPIPIPCFNITFEGREFHQILPGAWSNYKSAVLTDSNVFYRTESDVLNSFWKQEIPFVNVTPVPELKFKPLYSELPFLGSIEVHENFIIMWLIIVSLVLSFYVSISIIKSCRRTGFSVNPAHYLPLLGLPRAGASEIDGRGLATRMFDMILGVEFTTWIGYIAIFLLTLLVLVVCFKIMNLVKKSAKYAAELYSTNGYEEMHELRNSRARRI